MLMPFFSPITAAGIEFIGVEQASAALEPMPVTIPVGAQEGDLALLYASTREDIRTILATGFTDLQASSTKNTIAWGSFYKTLTAADITAGIVNISAGDATPNEHMIATLSVYRDAGIPVLKAEDATNTTTTVSVPSAVTAVDSIYVAAMGTARDTASVSAFPSTYNLDTAWLECARSQGVGGFAVFQEDAGTTVSGESFTINTADESYVAVFEIIAL